jgi:stringent starvation protein B
VTSNKPYLIRAIYEWICDNNMTPYVVINATDPMVKVPTRYIEDGKIVLNISATATQALRITNEEIEFMARFSGASMHVYAPVKTVLAIYARENNRGMIFNPSDEDDGGDGGSGGENAPASTQPKGKPKLRVVK